MVFRPTNRCNLNDGCLLCNGDGVTWGCDGTFQLASDGKKTLAVKVRMHEAFAPNAAVQKSGNIFGLELLKETSQTCLIKGCVQHDVFWLRSSFQKKLDTFNVAGLYRWSDERALRFHSEKNT